MTINQLKSSIKDILCNDFTGGVLTKVFRKSLPDIRWRGYSFRLPDSGVSKTNVAAIFWGFYESAEIRLIQKYIDGNSDVVELGASIGIVSGHIASKLKPGRKIISVEANRKLVGNVEANLKKFAGRNVNFKVLNYAVQYHVAEVMMHISDDNTESSVDERMSGKGENVLVPAITLGQIIESENLSDFTLVCDIEGSELEIILYDMEALGRCRNMLIEVHPVSHEGVHYDKEELVDKLIRDHQFKMVERQGNVCYFER